MFTDGMSRLAVAVSVTVVVSLAVFLTILVLLLADLFCSQLRRRAAAADNKRPELGRPASPFPPHAGAAADDAMSVATTATREALSSTPPFYYAHGVMSAPNNTKDLLLAIPKLESALWRWSPARRSTPAPSQSESSRGSSAAHSEGFMCISNPVYERGAAAGADTPPFETPDASPSACGITEEEEGGFSPPLCTMRKLPPLGVVACPPPALDGRPPLTVWPGMATDTNRASSSSSNLTTHFFSSWSSR